MTDTETPGLETFSGHLPLTPPRRFEIVMSIGELQERLLFDDTMRLLDIRLDHATAEVSMTVEMPPPDAERFAERDTEFEKVGLDPGLRGYRLFYNLDEPDRGWSWHR